MLSSISNTWFQLMNLVFLIELINNFRIQVHSINYKLIMKKCKKCSNVAEYDYKYYSNPAYCRKHKNSQMVYKKANLCSIL